MLESFYRRVRPPGLWRRTAVRVGESATTIEERIHASKNRVRHNMNHAVICIEHRAEKRERRVVRLHLAQEFRLVRPSHDQPDLREAHLVNQAIADELSEGRRVQAHESPVGAHPNRGVSRHIRNQRFLAKGEAGSEIGEVDLVSTPR